MPACYCTGACKKAGVCPLVGIEAWGYPSREGSPDIDLTVPYDVQYPDDWKRLDKETSSDDWNEMPKGSNWLKVKILNQISGDSYVKKAFYSSLHNEWKNLEDGEQVTAWQEEPEEEE